MTNHQISEVLLATGNVNDAVRDRIAAGPATRILEYHRTMLVEQDAIQAAINRIK